MVYVVECRASRLKVYFCIVLGRCSHVLVEAPLGTGFSRELRMVVVVGCCGGCMLGVLIGTLIPVLFLPFKPWVLPSTRAALHCLFLYFCQHLILYGVLVCIFSLPVLLAGRGVWARRFSGRRINTFRPFPVSDVPPKGSAGEEGD